MYLNKGYIQSLCVYIYILYIVIFIYIVLYSHVHLEIILYNPSVCAIIFKYLILIGIPHEGEYSVLFTSCLSVSLSAALSFITFILSALNSCCNNLISTAQNLFNQTWLSYLITVAEENQHQTLLSKILTLELTFHQGNVSYHTVLTTSLQKRM